MSVGPYRTPEAPARISVSQWKRLLCRCFGHKIRVTRVVNPYLQHLAYWAGCDWVCARCGHRNDWEAPSGDEEQNHWADWRTSAAALDDAIARIRHQMTVVPIPWDGPRAEELSEDQRHEVAVYATAVEMRQKLRDLP